MTESEYDRLTRRSADAKLRLDQAEAGYLNPSGGDGKQGQWLWRLRRNRALREYQAIEAERKRAAAPPAPSGDGE